MATIGSGAAYAGRIIGPTPIPVLYHIETTDPVVFVTIDDGFIARPELTQQLHDLGWPVANFVIGKQLERRPSYFQDISPNVAFGNHTHSHKFLPGLKRQGQINEICGGADDVQRLTGHRPTWLRPPGGGYNLGVVKAAADCGMKYVLMWDVSVFNGKISIAHRKPIAPGDIIILHYLSSTPKSITALANELHRLGLRPASLADYLPGVYDDSFQFGTTTTTSTTTTSTSSTTTSTSSTTSTTTSTTQP